MHAATAAWRAVEPHPGGLTEGSDAVDPEQLALTVARSGAPYLAWVGTTGGRLLAELTDDEIA